jgi:hypothetical protein
VDSQEVLKEILLDYLESPQVNVSSIGIKTSSQEYWINIDEMSYERMSTEMKEFIFQGPIYGEVLGLERLLQSMLSGNDLPIKVSLEIK